MKDGLRRLGGRAAALAAGRRVALALAATLLALLAAFGGALAYLSPDPDGRRITLDALSALADERRIGTAEFRDEDSIVVGTVAPARAARAGRPEGRGRERAAAAPVPLAAGERFFAAYPQSDAVTAVLVEMATAAGARVSVDQQATKRAVRLVATFLLPLVILANLFALLFVLTRGGGSGVGDVVSFGKLGGGAAGRGERSGDGGQGRAVTFADVAGADEAIVELREVVDYLANPERYAAIGAVPPKGVLLLGPPGCGKTLLARAVAGEAGVPFFSVAGAEFVESLVGVGAARVRDLFATVRAAAPAILFIDEIDAAGRRRGGATGGGSDEREQTLNQMLVEMDGFEPSEGVVVIGATNRPDILDPALLRPGRFDRHVTVDQPDADGRRRILELHARGKPIGDGVDLAALARRTPGFSGADLANVINEGALLAVREGKARVEAPELQEAVQRVVHGPKRRGHLLSDEERRRAAYHEAGHALAAAATGRADDVQRVSILARARGLGEAVAARDAEALLLTRAQLRSRLVVAMAGVAAEELVFGEPSTGAERDLERATELAREMLGRYGMSPALGRPRLLTRDVDGHLGAEVALAPLSAATHERFDAELRGLLAEAEADAGAVLAEHRQLLDALAERLERDETLEGDQLQQVLAAVRAA